MTKKPICIRADNDVIEAVEFFLKNRVSSAPVIDLNGNILGQLPELGLMRAFVRRKVQDTPLRKISDFRDQLIPPQFVLESAELPEVVRALIKSPLHRVLVQDLGTQLVGIISPKDMLRALSGDQHTGNMVQHMKELESQIKDLKQNLQDATQHEQLLNNIIESSVYMMHSADRDGKIIMANQVLHKNLGYVDGELKGKTIYDLYPQHLHQQVKESLEQIVKKGGHDVTYSTFLTKKGESYRVEVVSSSLTDSKGEFMGSFTVSRPIDSEVMLRALHGVLDKASG